VKPKPLKFEIAITVQRLNFGVFFAVNGRFGTDRTDPLVIFPLRLRANLINKKSWFFAFKLQE
jgi:hypothetical protein